MLYIYIFEMFKGNSLEINFKDVKLHVASQKVVLF